MMGSGEVKNHKVYASPRLHPKISFKDDWMKKGFRSCWRWKRLSTNPTNQRPKIQLLEQGDLEQQYGSSVQEIANVSKLAAKAPMKEQGDLFSSLCASVCQTFRSRQRRRRTRDPLAVNNLLVCSHSAWT